MTEFRWKLEDLTDLNQRQDHFNSVLGGVQGIIAGLHSDPVRGITKEDAKSGARVKHFGANIIPKTPPEPLWKLFLEALQDFTLLVLMAAAIVSIILDTNFGSEEHKKSGWVAGTAILFAVFLVATVTSLNNWSKERQFRKLEATNMLKITVIRSGELEEINVSELQVGDLVSVRTGDIVPADGVFVTGSSLSCDESAMTGESDACKKDAARPFFLSGTKAIDGEGQMLVTSVGVNTEIGRTKAKIDEESANNETPLEQKLTIMTKQIGKFGLFVAVATVVVSVIIWLNDNLRAPKEERFTSDKNLELIQFFILGVTILVVAIPEGLPLAVTISLAYSMQRMTKDKCLVRKLAACETSGGVTNICSDKTGTLTENKMTACEIWIGGRHHVELPKPENVNADMTLRLCESISANSNAYMTLEHQTNTMIFTGNKTEMALLVMCTKFGCNWEETRKTLKASPTTKVYPFSSAKKSMATVVPAPPGNNENHRRLYVKGGPDILLAYCTTYINESGATVPLTPAIRGEVQASIDRMANTGLRTLLVADRDFPNTPPSEFSDTDMPLDNLNLLAIAGIKDPLRPGVKEAVGKCKNAGIFVRMVTGDNVGTAKAIARECGILTDGVVVEGPTFRAMSESERISVLPKLQVIARSSPTDKYLLVDTLIKLGEVVAVTGDGTNDAAALAKADVGLAMGIAGTQVAKDAADIIILDDNFASIVRAVMWGRSVYDSVRKFLQFQLTINAVALLIVFIATCSRYKTPLTAVQLLWVNLIMDTFAALALGTEMPTEEILNRKPYGRFDPLVSRPMMRNMAGSAVLQLLILLVLLYRGDEIYNIDNGKLFADGKNHFDGYECPRGSSRHYTIIFNVFVFLQIFNELNMHKLHDDNSSVFHSLANPIFLAIMIGSAGFQAFIVEVGSSFTNTCGLRWYEWLTSIAIGFLSIPVGWLVRFIPISETSSKVHSETSIEKNASETTGNLAQQSQGKHGKSNGSIHGGTASQAKDYEL